MCAILHGLHGHRNIAVAGDQHDREFRIEGHDFPQEAHAVHARQANVADDDAAEVLADAAAGRFGTVYRFGGDAFQLQCLLAAKADIGVVFDDEDFEGFGHGAEVGADMGISREKTAPPSA